MSDDDLPGWVTPGAQVLVATVRDGQHINPQQGTVLAVGKRHVVVADSRGIERKFLTRTLSTSNGAVLEVLVQPNQE